MGILDGIVEWIAEQVMAGLDLITTSVLGALGCDMAVFLRYFPAAETMYSVFVALGIGIILLMLQWQKNSCARKWAIPRKLWPPLKRTSLPLVSAAALWPSRLLNLGTRPQYRCW